MGKKPKMALLPILGAAGSLVVLAQNIQKGYTDAGYTDHWQGVQDVLMAKYLGLVKNKETGALEFKTEYLMGGTGITALFLGGGYIGHKLANKMGINRAIPWFSL